MPWFKVDDGLSDHPKVLMAGNAAMGLWVRAGAWSMKHLTDGFVPAAVVALLGNGREARALVTAGLWVDVEGGYRFHDWEGRQPSKEAVQRDRDAAAERQKRARERARESRRDGAVIDGVSNGPPVPTRPDPLTTDRTTPDSQVTEADARVDDADRFKVELDAAKRQAVIDAEALAIPDLGDTRDLIESRLGYAITLTETVDLCRWIISKAKNPVEDGSAYVGTVVRKSPAKLRDMAAQLDLGGAA